MKKWQWALIVILLTVFLGLWFVPIFPDPYHKEETVNFYTWLYRELRELIYGEKEPEEEECD